MDFFSEIFTKLPRLGPGSTESTMSAVKMLPPLKNAKILDIGCGNGGQTITLAKAFPDAEITAVDIDEAQLERLNKAIAQMKLNGRVNAMNRSMHDLKFADESFDLIWCEGAIYNIGFAEGISAWKRYLKKNGFLVVSEASWISEPSIETKKFWSDAGCVLNFLDKNLIIIKEAGYNVIDFYIQPKTDWTDNYYKPMQEQIDRINEQYSKDIEAERVSSRLRQEIQMFSDHCEEYSYVFYIMKNK